MASRSCRICSLMPTRPSGAGGGCRRRRDRRQQRREQVGRRRSPSTAPRPPHADVRGRHRSSPTRSTPYRYGHDARRLARRGRWIFVDGDEHRRRLQPHGDRGRIDGLAETPAADGRRPAARGPMAVMPMAGASHGPSTSPPASLAGEAPRAAPPAQKLRIQFSRDAAVSHRRRVAWPRTRGHRRWPARRSSHRSRPAHPRPPATARRLRPRPAHGHRVRHGRRAVGRAARPDHRRPGRAADREPRLGQLAAHDAHRSRSA